MPELGPIQIYTLNIVPLQIQAAGEEENMHHASLIMRMP